MGRGRCARRTSHCGRRTCRRPTAPRPPLRSAPPRTAGCRVVARTAPSARRLDAGADRPHNVSMGERDIAVVLSGGGMNGVLLELGFLKRLRESELWPRVARIYGTSAGALSGTMAALDRLDDLERFVLALQPADTFRPQSLWRQPLNGLHTYTLPKTITDRIGDTKELARALRD